jgi:Protein of unknown function (DUF2281)
MSIADRIYEAVKTMPEQQAAEVLDFAEFLQAKAGRVNQEVTGALMTDYGGVLAKSPSFQDGPLEIQKAMRDEWR